MLSKLILGVGVVVLSFWLMLAVLDNWVYQQSDRDVRRASTSGPRPVFTLDTLRRNWALANFKTTAAGAAEAVTIGSRADPNEYQWLTDPIMVRPDEDLIVSYKIQVTDGKMGIGVLDFISSKWIFVRDITMPSDTIGFKTPTAQIQVILFGTSEPPTRTVLSALTVARP